jgi:hypothetical protein
LIVLLTLLYLFPPMIFWVMRHPHDKKKHPLAAYGVVCLSYQFRTSRQWWIAVLLAGRLVMASISSFVPDGIQRHLGLTLVAFLLMMLQMAEKPYLSSVVQSFVAMNTVVLTLLAIVANVVIAVDTNPQVMESTQQRATSGLDRFGAALFFMPFAVLVFIHLVNAVRVFAALRRGVQRMMTRFTSSYSVSSVMLRTPNESRVDSLTTPLVIAANDNDSDVPRDNAIVVSS